MLLGYFDESYFKKDFWYAAVLIPPSQVTQLNQSFSQILNDEGRQQKELHGSEIFAGTGPWTNYSIEQRKALYERCLGAICQAEAKIVLRGVRMSQRSTRERVAFRYLVEEIDKAAERSDDKVLLLGDESHERLQRELRQELRDISRWSTGGYKPRKITRTLDAPFFGPSDSSAGLQAADLVAFLANRYNRDRHRPTVASSQAALELWPVISNHVVVRNMWVPHT